MFRKKNKPQWELESAYQFAMDRLSAMETSYAAGEDKFTWEELKTQREYVKDLTAMKAAWCEMGRRRKVSPDQKVACGVTVIGFTAPYIIERVGRLANHIKGRVNLPKIWK